MNTQQPGIEIPVSVLPITVKVSQEGQEAVFQTGTLPTIPIQMDVELAVIARNRTAATTQTVSTQTTSQEPAVGTPWWVWFLLTLLFVGLIGGLVYFLTKPESTTIVVPSGRPPIVLPTGKTQTSTHDGGIQVFSFKN